MRFSTPADKKLWIMFGLSSFLLFAASLWGQETVYPEGSNVSVTSTISESEVETGNPIIIKRVISNNESFPLTNLYLSENLPPGLEIESYSLYIDGAETQCDYSGPLKDAVISGNNAFYWVIDKPSSDDTLNGLLKPGETLTLEYQISCLSSGTYSLTLNTTCFYGKDTGLFSYGDGALVTFVSDPICGDANNDGFRNIEDIIYIINYRYKDGPSPEIMETVDVDGDGLISINDVVYLINFLYKDGPELNCLHLTGE